MTSLRLLPWLSVWMLALFAMLAGPAMAQTTLSAESDASVAEEQPSYAALADLLEDEQARQELIELLRNQASELPAGVAAELSPEAAAAGGNVAPEDVSLPRQLAELTSRVVGDVGGQIEQAVAIVGNIFTGQGAGSSFDMAAFMNAAINLGIVIVATFAIFMVFRRLAKSLFTKISGWSQQGTGLTPVLRLVLCVAIAAVVDILLIALAYVGGNLVATFAVGETGELSTRASLFLNAFLIIELLKAGVRMLFSSRYEGLRLLPISAQEASYWNRWLARLIGMVGYGLMVVVPLVNFYVAATLGQAVGTLIMLLAFIYAVGVVLKNRVRLRDNLNQMSARSTLTASRVSLQLFARTWHLFALIYFLMVFVLTLTRPGDALPFVLFATLKTLGAVVVGLLLSTFLTQTIGRRIQLSDDLRRKLPLLEVRLNSYVPNALRVLRTVIVVAVIMVVLDAWGAFNLAAWYASERGANLVGNLISVAVILIVSLGIWLGLASLIEHKLNPETGHGEPSAFRSRREIIDLSQALTQASRDVDMLRAQAHEFSNKLYTISGLLQLQRIDEALALIHQETERAQAQMSFLMRHVADAVLSGTLLGKLTRARELGVTLEIDEQSSLSCPLTPTGQEVMMSVVGNLLDNACHAALNGPHGDQPTVRLFFTDLGEQLLIEVEDNGAGVPAEHAESIFAEGFSTKTGKHRGIGLALVARLCRQHGGAVTLEESELGGACFIAVLDRSLCAEAATEPAPSQRHE